MNKFIKVEHVLLAVDKIQYVCLIGNVLSIVCLNETKNIRFSLMSTAQKNFDYLTRVLTEEDVDPLSGMDD